MANSSWSYNYGLQNALFLDFKDAGFQMKLFLPALIYALLSSIGIPFDLSICFVTWKYRKSRRDYGALGSHTGLLIALNCCLDIVHQCCHFNFLAVTVSGANFVPAWAALAMNGLPFLAFCAIHNCILSLSVDRFIGVIAPIRYRSLKQRPYLAAHLALISALCLPSLYFMVEAVLADLEWPMTGFIGDLYMRMEVGRMQQLLVFTCCTNSLTILFYIGIGLAVKCRKTATTSSAETSSMRSLYRSLALIVGINVGAYFVIHLAYSIFTNYFLPVIAPKDEWVIFAYTSFGLSLVPIFKAPILYINSHDYRTAYRRLWKSIRQNYCCCLAFFRPNNAVNVNTAPTMRVAQLNNSKNWPTS